MLCALHNTIQCTLHRKYFPSVIMALVGLSQWVLLYLQWKEEQIKNTLELYYIYLDMRMKIFLIHKVTLLWCHCFTIEKDQNCFIIMYILYIYIHFYRDLECRFEQIIFDWKEEERKKNMLFLSSHGINHLCKPLTMHQTNSNDSCPLHRYNFTLNFLLDVSLRIFVTWFNCAG